MDCSGFRPVKLFATPVSVRCRKGGHNEPEHPDLFDDVVPLARRLQLVSEDIIQVVAQGDDPVCHRLDVSLPFLE